MGESASALPDTKEFTNGGEQRVAGGHLLQSYLLLLYVWTFSVFTVAVHGLIEEPVCS